MGHWYFHLAIALLSLKHVVVAFPTGAGSCDAGNPLGDGFHIARDQTTGDLATGGFELLLNGKVLTSDTVGEFPQSGGSNVLTLRATTANAAFRGYLIRVDYGNGEGDLMPDADGQLSPLCTDGVSGATHTNNAFKRSATAEMLVDDILTGEVSVEVTVVVDNSAEFQSVWYFNAFRLQQVARPPLSFPFAHFAFDGYVEPQYHEFYENLLGENFFKRCARRQNPPAEGELCRGLPKACMFGMQTCPTSPAGQLQPTTRCNCKNDKWSCQSFTCPTIGPVCPFTSPEILSPAFVCSTDLSCGLLGQMCCGREIPAQE